MKTSIATVSLSGDLADKLEAIARAGFDGVEIFENDLVASDLSAAEVRTLAGDLGLSITAFQPFRDFEGLPDDLRSKAFDRAERKFDLMQELGAELLLVCSTVSPNSIGGIDRAAADFRGLGESAMLRGMRVGYEALAWGRHVNDHRDAWEVVRRAEHPAVGLILDSFHTLARGTDPDTIRGIPGDRIFLVQVADAPWIAMDLLALSRHFRNMPGQGQLPVTAFLAAVAATGYDGFLSLEIFNDDFRAGSAGAIAVDGKRSLIAAMDDVARSMPAGSAFSGAPPMPPRAHCRGTEFLEFAVDDGAAAELRGLFGALGFSLAGRHVSKEVTWWRQGGINFVINAEVAGFAHSSFVTHGPNICAIGLTVDSAAETMSRAEALLARAFRQAVAPGEVDVPAVRGVGGGLLCFVDQRGSLARLWDLEFVPVAKPAANEVGLRSVDHISQSMEYDEMLSWFLFYTSVFDLEMTPEVDISEPGGLVRSRVVQARDGSVRIALNGALGHRTMSARFLLEFFGSGVQHVALAANDIFATADALARRGVSLLPIPGNYYDDLAARSGLAPDIIERLRERSILYDRDGAGEYLQIYTPPFADRFFFEIVERRGGYEGFGASNASIRLTAQQRAAGRTIGLPV